MARSRFVIRLAWCVAVAVATLAGRAQAERVALVIGNADHDVSRDLANPLNDARDVAARLGEIGFRLHRSEAQLDLSLGQMLEMASEFASSLEAGDVAVFYFAGHGVGYKGGSFLIPVDDRGLSTTSDLADRAFSVDFIVRRLTGRPVTSIVILDACRNNPLPFKVDPLSATAGKAAAEATRVVIVYSASAGQVASDGTGTRNSLFTAALLQALRDPVRRIDDIIYEVGDTVITKSQGLQTPDMHMPRLSGPPPYLIEPESPPKQTLLDGAAQRARGRDECCPGAGTGAAVVRGRPGPAVLRRS